MKKVSIALLLVTATLHAQDAARGPVAVEGPDPWFGTFSAQGNTLARGPRSSS